MAIPVVVKTFVIFSAGYSLERGTAHLVNNPTSCEAVDETMTMSLRLGGKSLSLCTNWLGGERLSPKGPHTSGNFWKMKGTEEFFGWRVMREYVVEGAMPSSKLEGV